MPKTPHLAKAPHLPKASHSANAIALKNVSYKIASTQCLYRIGFRLRGKVAVLLGANGAGKTLTLKIMQGVLKPTQGVMENLDTPHKVMVFQKPLILKQSLKKNLLFFLRASRAENAEARADAALHWCGLFTKRDQIATTLSVGQQQLLALARVYALDPQLLLLDEPTSSLDPKATRLIERLISQLAKQGCRVVMATQSMAQAKRLADEIILLDNGRVIEHCSHKEFFRNRSYESVL